MLEIINVCIHLSLALLLLQPDGKVLLIVNNVVKLAYYEVKLFY